MDEVGPFRGYTDEDLPLRSYAVLVLAFVLGVGAALISAVRKDDVPDNVALSDVLLLSMATHKLSRLLSKDTVTSWLRAPFTTYEGPGGMNELAERPRGSGMQRALGELIFCPPCVNPWVAAVMVYGLMRSPGVTRVIASLFSSVGIADFLHFAYTASRERAG